ncbi:SixA phosphatase family protein [Microbulbifer thermotolerans]|uniref:Histidine phosphatase family protein n=1 Tax=Microbulbifer thermotolerans TaxID=252514 RepID=A0A143HNT7_MICTH|nr:phosphoglycerate mutase family protein [Microbulbifer thermotolerans]AMX03383.1 hypothetical protein A3224_13045 [Microbulbifer thermotolerans]MCX2781195.1 histidine phosphatase family protein [Microbulbifer thermotolerans]MCX2783009.1 histidine phosphatase family protein [Microbulbifer thermotolerans]MCX2795459.1 histidine phosphatase family protein [Microbulbifer thermotolerans]MCX2803465.1 histidine phosphatase family protein [Microbulbifer thermotolerans]
MLRLVSIVMVLLVGAPWSAAQQLAEQVEPQVIYLVRHAEKSASGDQRDPALAKLGRERARHLAYVLGDARIEKIFTTDYARTRQTVEPLANQLGLTPEVYDPRVLREFAQQLLQTGGRSLVVGHSNTTPQLVALLGGDAGAAIDEKSEFDRLYIVIRDRGHVTTILQRYGREPALLKVREQTP